MEETTGHYFTLNKNENLYDVLDIHLFRNKLIVYAQVNGVYTLNLNTTSVTNTLF